MIRLWWSGEPDTEYLDVMGPLRVSAVWGFLTHGHQKKKARKPRRNLQPITHDMTYMKTGFTVRTR